MLGTSKNDKDLREPQTKSLTYAYSEPASVLGLKMTLTFDLFTLREFRLRSDAIQEFIL